MSYSLALDRMMNMVRTECPGAIDDAIKRALFDTMNEFFQDSNIWQETITVPIVANTTSYDIFPTSGGQINRLMWVYDNTNITDGSTGPSVTNVSMSLPGTITLGQIPSTARTYAVTVALTVTEPTTKDGFPIAPTWLCDKYATGDWSDGVIGKMCAQPAKPYSNQQLAIYHLKEFRGAIAKAIGESKNNNLYRGQAWRFPQTFAVRHR